MLLKNNSLFVILAVFMIMSFVTFSFVHALTGSSTSFGSLNINQDQISISEDELSIIQVTGTVEDYMRGVAIYLEISKLPEKSSHIIWAKYHDGYTLTEYARMENISVPGAKYRHDKALMELLNRPTIIEIREEHGKYD